MGKVWVGVHHLWEVFDRCWRKEQTMLNTSFWQQPIRVYSNNAHHEVANCCLLPRSWKLEHDYWLHLASMRTADVSPCSSPLRDVSRGGTFATQRQKFHTDDAKSVRNPVRSANWLTEKFHCFSYCLRMTDKRQKAAKVKCKRDESLTKQEAFLEEAFEFCWGHSKMNTTLYQNRPGEM